MDYASDRTCHVLSAVKRCLNIRKHNDDSWLRKQSLFTVTWAWHRDHVAWFADISISSNQLLFPPDEGTRWNRGGSPAGVWCFSWQVTQTHVHTKKLMFSSQQTPLTGTSGYLPVRTEMAEEGHDGVGWHWWRYESISVPHSIGRETWWISLAPQGPRGTGEIHLHMQHWPQDKCPKSKTVLKTRHPRHLNTQRVPSEDRLLIQEAKASKYFQSHCEHLWEMDTGHPEPHTEGLTGWWLVGREPGQGYSSPLLDTSSLSRSSCSPSFWPFLACSLWAGLWAAPSCPLITLCLITLDPVSVSEPAIQDDNNSVYWEPTMSQKFYRCFAFKASS